MDDFFRDYEIKIPANYAHEIENSGKDLFYKNFRNVVLSCYFTGKKDPIHHASLENERRDIDNYEYMKPLYESCRQLNIHLVIFHDNLSSTFIEKYQTEKIIFRKTRLVSNLSINDERYIIYYEYLLKNPYKNVFSSDIGDVFLMKNPFGLLKNYYKRDHINTDEIDDIIMSENTLDQLQKSTYALITENKCHQAELKRHLFGLRKIKRENYDESHLIFIGTNSIDSGPKSKTPRWFERRQAKIDRFNEVLHKYLNHLPQFVSGNFQIYNPGTIMSNYSSFMCFMKKFIGILLECCRERENMNWNMVIATYICRIFLSEGYDQATYHTKYIYTGFPFNSMYQRREDQEKTLCYVVHK